MGLGCSKSKYQLPTTKIIGFLFNFIYSFLLPLNCPKFPFLPCYFCLFSTLSIGLFFYKQLHPFTSNFFHFPNIQTPSVHLSFLYTPRFVPVFPFKFILKLVSILAQCCCWKEEKLRSKIICLSILKNVVLCLLRSK